MAQKTEYAVKTIDEHGDVIDVDHFDHKGDAVRNAERVVLCDDVKAVVIGRRVWEITSDGDEADRGVNVCVFVRGDPASLRAGSWQLDWPHHPPAKAGGVFSGTTPKALTAECEGFGGSMSSTTAIESIKVGDILVATWGYDQTNASFFEVIRVRESALVTLMEIKTERFESSPLSMCGTTMPRRGEHGYMYQGELIRRKLHSDPRIQGGAEFVKVEPYMVAWKWDGSPVYTSWYA